MSQSFRIETLDRSGRWYLTPGARSVYDLRIRNDSKGATDCSLVVEDPVSGVDIEPAAFSLGGHEMRTVTVTFAADTPASRSQRVLLSLHADSDGSLLTTFEQPLIVTGGTDCSVAMAWKDPILEAGAVRGFEMACSVRSQSEGRSTFRVALTPHPAFSTPALPELTLEPGQAGEVVMPIRWDRSVKDAIGWNHPAILEISVAVSNGRRTSRMRWELIEAKIEPYLRRAAAASNRKTTLADGGTRAARAPAAPSPALMYLLNGCVEKLMLAAPAGAQLAMLPGIVSHAAAGAPARVAAPTVKANLCDDPKAAIELPLFAAPSAAPPNAPPAPAKLNKLTPYTPARWNGSQQQDTIANSTTAAAPAPQPSAASAADALAHTPTPAVEAAISMPAHVIRQRQVERLRKNPPVPAALLIGGLALVALVVAAVFGFRPSAQPPLSTTPVAVSAPVLATDARGQSARLALAARARARGAAHAKHAARSAQRSTAATVAAAREATPAAAAPAEPATTAATGARPSGRHSVAVAAAPRHAFPHIKLYQPESGPVVALGEIQAYYGPRGRAVRVYWGAAEQASASVQLIDDHGAVVSATSVRGGRQSALLFLPRRFHGALTVQVSSVGRMGERVANTASLPAYGG